MPDSKDHECRKKLPSRIHSQVVEILPLGSLVSSQMPTYRSSTRFSAVRGSERAWEINREAKEMRRRWRAFFMAVLCSSIRSALFRKLFSNDKLRLRLWKEEWTRISRWKRPPIERLRFELAIPARVSRATICKLVHQNKVPNPKMGKGSASSSGGRDILHLGQVVSQIGSKLQARKSLAGVEEVAVHKLSIPFRPQDMPDSSPMATTARQAM